MAALQEVLGRVALASGHGQVEAAFKPAAEELQGEQLVGLVQLPGERHAVDSLPAAAADDEWQGSTPDGVAGLLDGLLAEERDLPS